MSIEGLFIKTSTGLLFADEETQKRYSQIADGEIIQCSTNEKLNKRSLTQLGLFWACAKVVAETVNDPSWDKDVKVHDQCLIEQKLFDHWIQYENKKTGEMTLNVKLKSIATNNMTHFEACEFFDNAFEYMAAKIGLTKDELEEETKSRMVKHEY